MDKDEIVRLRQLPLETVLEGFSAQRDPQDPTRNWKTQVGRITITEGKFYNHDQDKGGGGAIDLVMHMGDFSFPKAVAWLGGQVGKEAAIAQYQAEAVKHAGRILETTPSPKLEVPAPDAGKLGRVKNYLVEKRAIPESIVDTAIEKGRLWADKYGNAVFGLRDVEGNQVGAELRGTYDKPFHGVRGEKGLFFTGNASTKTAVFVESAIDAMSYQAINPRSMVISTTGSSRDLLSKTAEELHGRGFRLVAGFDNDKEGNRLAEVLNKATGKQVERQVPAVGKDWNDQLKKQGEVRIGEREHDR
jgi:hypothetical protein